MKVGWSCQQNHKARQRKSAADDALGASLSRGQRRIAPLLSGFKDDSLYFVAPGGDFENGAPGWQLEGGAQVESGSSVLAPLGAGGSSLRLPAGSAATSPAFCVDERYPKFRLTGGQLG